MEYLKYIYQAKLLKVGKLFNVSIKLSRILILNSITIMTRLVTSRDQDKCHNFLSSFVMLSDNKVLDTYQALRKHLLN